MRTIEIRASTEAGNGLRSAARAAMRAMFEIFGCAVAHARFDDAVHVCRVAAVLVPYTGTCTFGWRLMRGQTPDTTRSLFEQTILVFMDQPKFVTVGRAAAMLHCSPQYIRRLARESRIAARRAPAGYWVCETESLYRYRARS